MAGSSTSAASAPASRAAEVISRDTRRKQGATHNFFVTAMGIVPVPAGRQLRAATAPDGGGIAVAQHERQLLRGQHHVDRVDDRARLQRPVVGDDPLPPVLRVERHRPARLDAAARGPGRDAVAQCVQLTEPEGAGGRHQRRLVAVPRRAGTQDLARTVHSSSPSKSGRAELAASRPRGGGPTAHPTGGAGANPFWDGVDRRHLEIEAPVRRG